MTNNITGYQAKIGESSIDTAKEAGPTPFVEGRLEGGGLKKKGLRGGLRGFRRVLPVLRSLSEGPKP